MQHKDIYMTLKYTVLLERFQYCLFHLYLSERNSINSCTLVKISTQGTFPGSTYLNICLGPGFRLVSRSNLIFLMFIKVSFFSLYLTIWGSDRSISVFYFVTCSLVSKSEWILPYLHVVEMCTTWLSDPYPLPEYKLQWYTCWPWWPARLSKQNFRIKKKI